MQILFETKDTPQMYAYGNGRYPDAPLKCPHKDCHAPVKMRKHGFYERYVSIKEYIGKIRVRRYICAVCGRTVSMLPSFCVPWILHSVEVIIMALLVVLERGSVRYAGTKWSERPETLTRRHIIYYLERIKRNRGIIQLALNLISPGFVELKQITGDMDWTRKFLQAAKDINPQRFNAKYHALIGASFMSLHNNVA